MLLIAPILITLRAVRLVNPFMRCSDGMGFRQLKPIRLLLFRDTSSIIVIVRCSPTCLHREATVISPLFIYHSVSRSVIGASRATGEPVIVIDTLLFMIFVTGLE